MDARWIFYVDVFVVYNLNAPVQKTQIKRKKTICPIEKLFGGSA